MWEVVLGGGVEVRGECLAVVVVGVVVWVWLIMVGMGVYLPPPNFCS